MKRVALPFRITPGRLWIAGLLAVIAAGAVSGLLVFYYGLGITNLSDLVPWGLWITIDLSSIALSAGAFSLCAVVYLVGYKRFQSVARTATFIGLIGYSMAMLCLLLDIGRPDRFWHGFVFWNPHSVLWEVTMCVGFYFSVLALESIPIFGRAGWLRARWPRLSGRMAHVHHFAPYLALAGLCLSLLHQSSLGATYGILKARPFWYRPDLAILFILSAVIGGISLTILASMLSSRFSSRARPDGRALERLAQIVGWLLVFYLYFRFWDAFSMTYTYEAGRTEGLRLLTRGPLALNFWIGEILLGIIIPILLLVPRRYRLSPNYRMLALGLVVAGLVLYRWDTNLAGQMVVLSYLPQEEIMLYTGYIPSLVELVSAAGIVAYGLLAFTLGVRYLGVVDKGSVEAELARDPVETEQLSEFA
jgi:Ni/Fe-hydrogenase subunit HybB-like protein